MKIAIFSDNFYPELSGISDSVMETGKQLGLRGHEVVFVAPEYSRNNYEYVGLQKENPDLGPSVHFVRLPSFDFGGASGQGRMVLPLGRAKHRLPFRPEVVHVNLPFGIGIEGLMTAKSFRIPVVGTDHTPMKEFVRYSPIGGNWVEKIVVGYNAWFYKRCSFVSSPAKVILDELSEHGVKATSEKISNPIRFAEFSSIQGGSELKKGFGFGPFTVLYAGRLAPEKGVGIIVRAVAEVIKSGRKIDFAIMGRGPEEEKLKQKARDLGIQDFVHFLGFVEQEDMPKIFSAVDVFSIISTAETQCMAAMNALAAAKPLIAADALGLGEYAREGRQIVVDPGSVSDLTHELIRLYDNPEERIAIGRAGQEMVSGFAPEKIAEKWEGIYQKVIANHVSK